MEIDINQKKISIGDKYQIFIEGLQAYYATRAVFFLLPEIKLFENADSDKVIITINKRFSLIKAKYYIKGNEGVFEFRGENIYASYFQCQCGADRYDIYGHAGRKFSIYKNNVQIAWWEKKAVTWFSGDNYKIIADYDSNSILLISFCLIIDNFSSNNKGDIVSYDIGVIGVEERDFNNNWLPK